MATSLLKVKGLNVVLVVFSLLVLGGAAVALSNPQIFKSGASGNNQSAIGLLAKKGTPAFSPCRNVNATYALIGAKFEAEQNTRGGCTQLAVQSKLADPLVGKRVVATGTFQNGVFYATSLRLASNLEQMPSTGGSNKVATPAPTTCPGLGVNAVCSPKATNPSQLCCSPYTCTTGTKLGGYRCGIGRPSTQ